MRIAVMTSGGDAPGMNACVRAVVKGARSHGLDVLGVRYGAVGLLRNSAGDYIELLPDTVTGIVNQSGTVLKTARDEQVIDFLSDLASVAGIGLDLQNWLRSKGVAQLIAERAHASMVANSVDGLILIGGDQTCRGALVIHEGCSGSVPMLVIPATIDNDVEGTDQTIGFDSAVVAAVQAVDAIRASAGSHSRIFIVQVMGRTQGHIAVEVALACGAEEVLIPEHEYTQSELAALCQRLKEARTAGQESVIIVVAEGVDFRSWDVRQAVNAAEALEHVLREDLGDWEIRIAVLGHLQRGAPPTPFTRNLASRMAIAAVDELVDCIKSGGRDAPRLVGLRKGQIAFYPVRGSMVRKSRPAILAAKETCARLSY